MFCCGGNAHVQYLSAYAYGHMRLWWHCWPNSMQPLASNNVNFGDMSTNRLQADSIRLLCGICSGFVHVLGHRVAFSMVSHGQASVFNSEPGILSFAFVFRAALLAMHASLLAPSGINSMDRFMQEALLDVCYDGHVGHHTLCCACCSTATHGHLQCPLIRCPTLTATPQIKKAEAPVSDRKPHPRKRHRQRAETPLSYDPSPQ